MKSSLLTELNTVQQQAVTFSGGNLLVLAGAGSGKTRVLVHRIAWLLSQGVSLQNILAVTFTNKAAREMRGRLEGMLQQSLASMWIGTFHGLSHRFLRQHWQEANLDQNFQIIDVEDQLRLIKRIHKELALDPERWLPKQSQSFINHNKENAVRANFASANEYAETVLCNVYKIYEETCSRSGLIDFAELLLRTNELWRNNSQLREFYQNRFKHILVDEFQDTNTTQYSWVKSIFGKGSSLTAVGDDDQSIYSWRGADSGNMQQLEKDYPNVSTVKLEQNYRSTATILGAANAVIANNNNRLGKKLWTDSGDGEQIVKYSAFNEIDEARYLVDKIKGWIEDGGNLSDVGILYRSNAQSRVIEEQLLRSGVSYRIYGGTRFFERAEIKDVLAYLRLLINRHDAAAFERVVNLPTRGIGEAAMATVRSYAKSHEYSLWKAAQDIIATDQLSSRAASALGGFVRLIDEAATQVSKLNLAELFIFVINLVGLRDHYTKIKGGEYKQSRLENLDELINAAQQFATFIAYDDGNLLLQEFLSHVALESGEYIDNNDNEYVNLMTLHAAKGLEFPLVFLCGMEDGLFPHIMSMETRDDLEEERRLCYVGMTRAMRKLYLLHATSRRLRGSVNNQRPSRFLREIPSEFIESSSLVNSVKPAFSEEVDFEFASVGEGTQMRIGQPVMHEYFGEGIITDFDGDGEYMSVQVRFKKFGTKSLYPQYLQLM